jgi:Uma2 family endonuclease
VDILVTDANLKRELLRRRRAWGGDRWDEVWNGVYVMSPLEDDRHQDLATKLSAILIEVVGPEGNADVRAGVNVSDRDKGWRKNYRIPDVALRYHDGISQVRERHWRGGPDFVVEVASRGDRSRKKRPFYAKIGVREMMLIDRNPWAIELYRLEEGELRIVGKSTLDDPQSVPSEVVPLAFRLVEEGGRPRVEAVHREDGRRWLA